MLTGSAGSLGAVLTRVGFWRPLAGRGYVPGGGADLPDVRDHVDPGWDPAERAQVLAYLQAGADHATYRGASECRLCGARNGCAEQTDGVYVWPEGLAHYVERHDVRPPRGFVDHVLARRR